MISNMYQFDYIYDVIPFLIITLLSISCINKKANGICLFIAAIVVYGIVSSRGLGVDRDALVYHSVFNVVRNIPFGEISKYSSVIGQEVGFLSLEKLASICGLDFFEFRFVFNLLCLIALLYIIFEYIPGKFRIISYFIYVSMFLLFRDFTQIRLCFACLLSAISILKMLENKPYKSFLLFYIAVLFHNTSLIVFGVLLVVRFVNEKTLYNIKFALFVISICAFLSILKPANYLITLPFMPSQLTRYQGTNDLSGATLGVNFIFSIVLAVLLAFYYNRKEKRNIGYKYLYISMLGSTCIALVFNGVPILMRMQLLCFTGFIFFPAILYDIFMKKSLLGNYIFQLAIAVVFVLNFYKNLSSGIVYAYVPFWIR